MHSNSTDGWNIEYKHKEEVFIPPYDSPKIFIASNTVLAGEGTTNKRRQFIIEFSNHYSKHIIKGNEEPVRNEHGCMFFSNDWDENEWNLFDNFMIECLSYYLAENLQTYEHKNLKKNQLLKLTCDDFEEFSERFEFNKKHNTRQVFDDFREIYGYEENEIKQRSFSGWIKTFASIHSRKATFERSNGESFFTIE